MQSPLAPAGTRGLRGLNGGPLLGGRDPEGLADAGEASLEAVDLGLLRPFAPEAGFGAIEGGEPFEMNEAHGVERVEQGRSSSDAFSRSEQAPVVQRRTGERGTRPAPGVRNNALRSSCSNACGVSYRLGLELPLRAIARIRLEWVPPLHHRPGGFSDTYFIQLRTRPLQSQPRPSDPLT